MNLKTKDDKHFEMRISIKHDRFLFNFLFFFLFSSSSSSSTILSRLCIRYTLCICLILELFCVESTNKIVHFLSLAVELLSNLQQHFKNKRFRCSASFSFHILLFLFYVGCSCSLSFYLTHSLSSPIKFFICRISIEYHFLYFFFVVL